MYSEQEIPKIQGIPMIHQDIHLLHQDIPKIHQDIHLLHQDIPKIHWDIPKIQEIHLVQITP